MNYDYLVHALVSAILTLATFIVYFRRNKRDSHLVYWGWACLIWVFYYSLKSAGMVGVGAEMDSTARLSDIGLSLFNSVTIFLCSVSLRFRIKGPQILVLIVSIGAILLVLSLLFSDPEDYDLLKVTYTLTWPTAIVGAVVLVLLYHMLTERLPMNFLKTRAFALWIFVGYALIQVGYPQLFEDKKLEVERVLYFSAMVGKLAGTLFLLLSAPTVAENAVMIK